MAIGRGGLGRCKVLWLGLELGLQLGLGLGLGLCLESGTDGNCKSRTRVRANVLYLIDGPSMVASHTDLMGTIFAVVRAAVTVRDNQS